MKTGYAIDRILVSTVAAVALFWPGRIVVGRARRLRVVGAFAIVIGFAGLAGVVLSTVSG